CFEAIKAGVDTLPPGTKMFLNGGWEFYGHNLATMNLETIARFFEKYPDYVDKTFLSIKGGLKLGAVPLPDGSPANLRRSVELISEKLRGTKRLDLFQSARVDPNVSLEDSITALVELKNEGKLDHIVISECSADSLRRGNAVHPIAAVEIEVSPWAYEEETKNVIATAEELGIAVIAYSPLGHGFLTGQIKRLEDIPGKITAFATYICHAYHIYQREIHHLIIPLQNFKQNFAIVDALTAIARSKNVTSAQLSIAWVASLGKHVIPLPGSSALVTRENSVGGDIKLSTEDIAEINSVISAADVKGDRFGYQAYLWG
ncbi:hypothetical protein CY34DRAFT_72426, partial [Suillus luteus UH-Slu-Lm8-n1]